MILEVFDSQYVCMMFMQVVVYIGFMCMVVWCYLLMFELFGYVYIDGKLYGFMLCVFWVGWLYFDLVWLLCMVQFYLQQLSVLLNELVYVSVLDGWEFVFIVCNGVLCVMMIGFVFGVCVLVLLMLFGVVLFVYYFDCEVVCVWFDEIELLLFMLYMIINKVWLFEQVDQVCDVGYVVIEQ